MRIPFQASRWTALLGLVACVTPIHAIVTAGSDPNANVISYGETFKGVDLSGIVQITSSVGGCTGSLLTGGLSILTAAHCLTSAYGAPIATGITVYFQTPGGLIPGTVSSVQVNPGYTGDGKLGNDLAVLTLTQPAPAYDIGYSLYTSSAIPHAPVVLAGYGLGGTGDTGANLAFGTLRAGENVFERTGDFFGSDWSSNLLIGQLFQPCEELLQRDCTTNALGAFNPFYSINEVSSAHGDSGGPAFYNGMLIGVTDLGICYTLGNSANCLMPPSVSIENNSFFGEMFAYTSVAGNLDFILNAQVPEPGTITLCLCALGVVLARRRHRSVRS